MAKWVKFLNIVRKLEACILQTDCDQSERGPHGPSTKLSQVPYLDVHLSLRGSSFCTQK